MPALSHHLFESTLIGFLVQVLSSDNINRQTSQPCLWVNLGISFRPRHEESKPLSTST